MGRETLSTDTKFDRGWRSLTSEYIRSRLERLDEMLADPKNSHRTAYLEEQRDWWAAQLPFAYRREGLLG
jgi:hypothetical protein